MNERRFEALIARHLGAVSAYARALCRDFDVADEAVQMTLLRSWRYIDTFDGRGSFEGWLLRICRNCIIDLSHRTIDHDDVARFPSAVQQPDHSHDLIELLSALPMAQREVVVICALLGYDYESASRILDIPIGTVRSRLSRGRAGVAEMLRNAEEGAAG